MMNSFPRESLILLKPDGSHFENVKALVDKEIFFIEDYNVIIEEGDFFERKLPNGSKEYYYVKDRGFVKGTGRIPDHYQTSVEKVDIKEMEKTVNCFDSYRNVEMIAEQKPSKVFISHSTEDKKYMRAFVELLEAIGMPEDSIVCTSVPGYGTPGELKIYDWLKIQFTSCSLRVIFAFSENYFNSPACLNEMGAAWLTQAKHTLMVLPGFGFNDIRGCVDPTEAGINLGGDEDELKYRLNELKDTLLAEHSLPSIKNEKWERKRDEFISRIHVINMKNNDEQNEELRADQKTNKDCKVQEKISKESLILLEYAADADGQITRIPCKEGTLFSAGGKNVMSEIAPRESSKWQNALDELLDMGLIEKKGQTGTVFAVTFNGYEMFDLVKNHK